MKLKLNLLCLLFFITGILHAQDLTISGKVVDEDNQPLVGASVLVKGTKQSAIADLNGNFTLSNVPANAMLDVSFIGYQTYSVAVNGQTQVNVQLQPDAKVLDEVVVTALGIKRSQKALAYNVQRIDRDAVNVVKDANFITSLSGKVAGLNIQSVVGGVGSVTRVTTRGSRSLSQSNVMLYVIDGMPMYNYAGGRFSDEYSGEVTSESIADINPDDIESMTMLNGAAAAALYGAKAANGAILITTKRGVSEKTKISVSNQTTFSTPLIMPKFQTKYGNNVGSYESWGNELPTPSTYQPRDFFNTGVSMHNTVSVATGNQKNQIYASAAAINAAGIVPNNAYDRYNLTFRNTTLLLDDKMTLDFNFNFVRQYDRNMVS